MKKTAYFMLFISAGIAGCTPAETRMVSDIISAAAGMQTSHNTYRPRPINVYNPPRPTPIHIPVNTITPNPTDSGIYGGINSGNYRSGPCVRTGPAWCGIK